MFPRQRLGSRSHCIRGGSCCLRRTLGTASHETGHILGLRHCTAYSCLMNGSNHQEEKDRRPRMWPICLRKLCWNLEVEPVAYLTDLKAFCQQNGVDAEAHWYACAIGVLKDSGAGHAP